MRSLLIAGTSSDAGKSLVVTGLCRLARRRGLDVVPYKAQNMSNNSMVCRDGSEIGRAQYLQALAAGVEPSSAMNPVLLKPGSDRRSHIVLRGQPGGVLVAGEYTTGRRHLAEAAWEAFEELAAAHDLVLCEGAGSPAEINLREGDYTNMGLARRFGLPVVLVGDIDRGGVLASIFGTWGLLDEADRALLAGYVINKFRGDAGILQPGLDELTQRTALTSFGVLPWVPDVWLDGEDSLSLGSWQASGVDVDPLRVAVVKLPRISNATDIDALAQEPGVLVTLTRSPGEVRRADLVVVPGSRSTLHDLAWLRSLGLDAALRDRAAAGRPTLAICGGYQMLTEHLDDPGVEADQPTSVDGLGLLPARVRFAPEKVLRRPVGQWRGRPVTGYEVHHGPCVPHGGDETFLGGVRQGQTWGTMWHGSLECDAFRRAWLTGVAEVAGSSWRPVEGAPGFAERRETMINTLADAMEEHLDVDALLALARPV